MTLWTTLPWVIAAASMGLLLLEKQASRERVAYEIPDDVQAYFDGKAEPIDVDFEGHLRWLETGEGEPWPAPKQAIPITEPYDAGHRGVPDEIHLYEHDVHPICPGGVHVEYDAEDAPGAFTFRVSSRDQETSIRKSGMMRLVEWAKERCHG